jgi:hypothetical protein
MVFNMLQLQLLESAFRQRKICVQMVQIDGIDLLLALGVKVYALDAARDLVEGYVVEPFEAGSADGLYSVVWDQEVLFPAHEEVLLLHPVFGDGIWPRGGFGGLVGWKPRPVLPVDFLVGAPFWVLCYEVVLVADDLAFEVGGQAGVVIRQAWSGISSGLVRRLFLCAPWMRRYPHMNDSRMSTCLISTSTSYCWRSEVWLPLNRLPGRRSEEDVTGRNCVAVSKH